MPAARWCFWTDRCDGTRTQDQLLLIRGAVAEYERTLIAERMRRGRQAKLRPSCLLPWSRAPYGYRLDPDHPRDPAGVTLEPAEAAGVQELFAGYVEDHASLFSLAKHLQALGIPSPDGRSRWSPTSLRGILTNPTYTGQVGACLPAGPGAGRWRSRAPRSRRSATHPIGKPSDSPVPPPPLPWLPVASVPALVSGERFAQVQAKLAQNRAFARRHNTAHSYLLRALVSCGVWVELPVPHAPSWLCRLCLPQQAWCRTPYRPWGVPGALRPGASARDPGVAGPVRTAHPSRADRPGPDPCAWRRPAAAGAAGAVPAAPPGPARPRAAAGAADRSLPAHRHAAGRIPAPAAGAGAALAGPERAGKPAGGQGGPLSRTRRLGRFSHQLPRAGADRLGQR